MMSQRVQFPASAGAADEPALPGSYGIAPSGHRLPAGTHVGSVRLQVADLGRSLAWYERVLGFRVLAQSATVATLGAEGATLPLIELNQHAGALPAPRRGRLGLFHYAILLPDRPALGRFLAHLNATSVAAGAADHLVSESLYLLDPDGLGIEVYADRPRQEWRRHGRELVMTTLPLDAPGLVQAGGGQPWTTMPPGTALGHMHLHVGDLDQAAAFYHVALGLEVMVWNYPGALFLAAGGYHHHLGLNTWAGQDAERPLPGEARLLEWELVVPGVEQVEAARRGMAAAGHTVKQDSEGWVALDPSGTLLRLRSGAPAA
jgi:catechol 2,3-dioxygenase